MKVSYKKLWKLLIDRQTPQCLGIFPALIPDSDTLNRFTKFCTPIFGKQEIIEAESRRLSTLRDTLLPKLMSGEIDVSEVEI